MPGKAPLDARAAFGAAHYQEINHARLLHLDFVLRNAGIETAGLSLIEVGAGIGDHTPFWLERGCKVTITEPREENLAILRERFPSHDIRAFDLDKEAAPQETFDIVYAYGLLYHLSDPAGGIAKMAGLCSGMLFLETCVSYGSELAQNLVDENALTPSQATSGTGCRPTRPWIFTELKKHWPHVYQPSTQPTHAQFPTDWRPEAAPEKGLVRTTFVASRNPIQSATLFPHLLERQSLMPAESA